MITTTSLTHPTMIGKICKAINLAVNNNGHLMNGHNHRCYIQNRKGLNIMRLDYTKDGLTVYGSESRIITEVVISALIKATCPAWEVGVRYEKYAIAR